MIISIDSDYSTNIVYGMPRVGKNVVGNIKDDASAKVMRI